MITLADLIISPGTQCKPNAAQILKTGSYFQLSSMDCLFLTNLVLWMISSQHSQGRQFQYSHHVFFSWKRAGLYFTTGFPQFYSGKIDVMRVKIVEFYVETAILLPQLPPKSELLEMIDAFDVFICFLTMTPILVAK